MRLRIETVLLAIALAAVAAPVDAGTIDVHIRRRDGSPVARQSFVLSPAEPEPEPGRRPRRGTTDDVGRARIEDMPPARYTLRLLPPLADGSLLLPDENPKEPTPVVTLAEDDATAALTLVLWPGIPIRLRIAVDTPLVPPARIDFRDVDVGGTIAVELDETGYGLRALPAGRWEGRWEPIPGFLLVDVLRNGDSLDGDHAMVDLSDPELRPELTFVISGRARLEGTVILNGEYCGGVVATLVEPGPWHEAALRRGGSLFTPLQPRVEPITCRYELTLPDGLWLVTPIPTGEGIVAEPESVDMLLAHGATGRADFTIRGARPGSGSERAEGMLVVDPVLFDGGAAVGAVVEAWPLDPALRGEAPIATATRERRRPAILRGLTAGAYVIVAGHIDGLEGEVEVAAYKPTTQGQRPVRVELRRGGALHVSVRTRDGEPAAGVSIAVTRLAREPSHPLRGDPLDQAKRQRTIVTDASGQVAVTGLDPGTWRVGGSGAEPAMAGQRLWLRDGERLRDAVEVEIPDGALVKVGGVVAPAPALRGTLRCREGFQLPSVTAVRVVPSAAVAAGEDPVAGATLTRDDVPVIDGAFTVGPLGEGTFRLAVRPAGFDWWTWYPGVDDALHADALSVAVEAVDGGDMDLACGPLVVVRPRVLSGQVLPDLRGAWVAVRELDAAGVEVTRGPAPRVVVRPEEAHIRGIEEGKPKLQVAVHHRYFLPGGVAFIEAELTLSRFHAVTLAPAVEAIGGAVRVHLDAVAARLVATTGEGDRERAATVSVIEKGVASFDAVVPGSYRVEACGDPACGTVLTVLEDVVVEAAKDTVARRLEPKAR